MARGLFGARKRGQLDGHGRLAAAAGRFRGRARERRGLARSPPPATGDASASIAPVATARGVARADRRLPRRRLRLLLRSLQGLSDALQPDARGPDRLRRDHRRAAPAAGRRHPLRRACQARRGARPGRRAYRPGSLSPSYEGERASQSLPRTWSPSDPRAPQRARRSRRAPRRCRCRSARRWRAPARRLPRASPARPAAPPAPRPAAAA